MRAALFLALAVVGPGLAVQRALRLPVDPALVLPLGLAACAGGYWLALVAGTAWVFAALLLAAGAALVWPVGPWRMAAGPSLRGAVPPVLALVALLALTQYRWNRVGPTGEFLLDPLVASDTAFHVGLTRELALGYPPQVPGVSGFPLGYHLGPDLVRAAALRYASVDPYDALSRLDVTLGAVALVLALRGLASRLGASPLAVALAPWTLLATDFSFVFAGNPSAVWWTDVLRGNVLLSLFVANPVVPALALTLGVLVALSRHLAGEGTGWLALAFAGALAVPFFKVFLGAHLLLGLGVAWLLTPAARRALAIVALPCAAATTALVVGTGGSTVVVQLAPLDLVRMTRESLELAPLHGARLAAWSLLWIAASLGLRALGLPATVRALRSGAAGAAAAAIALSGWPLGLLFRVAAPEMLPGQRAVNDAAYLVEQAGPVLWVFTAMAIAALAARHTAALTLAAAAALALPSTAQFVARKALQAPDPVPAPMVRAMRDLEAATAPGDVVLQRPGARFPPLPVILIGRRVPYERFTPWLTQFAPAAVLEQRHEAVFRFFRTTDAGEAAAIAADLHARAVCLYGPDRLRFDTAGALRPIHEEPGASCYAWIR